MKIARDRFHKNLLANLLTINAMGVPGNADGSNKTSIAIARGIADRLMAETGVRAVAQTSGDEFENLISNFVAETLPKLSHVRPGKWDVKQVKTRGRAEIGRYAQYHHLVALQKAAERDPELAAVLGNDYSISPDVIVIRFLEDDDSLNTHEFLVDQSVSTRADLRENGTNKPLLHASISTKWTLRSDRAQNARSEALNLIRNRKGRQPHIMVVTGEPTPSRLASLALGTGDIDCVYHIALPELIASVSDLDNSEAEDMLGIMVNGRRLKDISDLPLDLAV
ncbi:NgoMIV family type II restriction endonuclease [Acidiphilium acidophilum]|uniref:NgoMIV family type II restriction endonuclease n=1 Tax=Acidiphilium acidophilum TaxID=76588 RepID=UPI002E8E6830|nr:NgoMIV family type II restriction endonuclease [Acidiphilium acidophilum]